jgi:hypothetical protein
MENLEGLDLVNELLGLRLVETVRSDEYKGIKIDPEDGGTNKFYLNAADCKRLSEAFAVMAIALKENG